MRHATSINPANGETIAEYPLLDAGEQDAALDRAARGYAAWSSLQIDRRAAIIARLGDELRGRAEHLARTITIEMGKPIKQARGEVAKCAALCDWYAANGPALIADEPTTIPDGKASVAFLPLGVVLGVMPWNFPLWQVLRAAAPIMLAGNGFLLKHAQNVLGSARNLADAMAAAGVPDGAFTLFDVGRDDVPRAIADDRVAAVTLTGSVGAGAAVAAAAGRAIKKSVLELGGSDPFIVLADADLDRAVAAAVEARFLNGGQVCIAAKRLIVETPVLDVFTERFVAAASALVVGDPLDEATFIGPMARRDLRAELAGQVARTREEGATVALAGGETGHEAGAFFAPTVLTGVAPGMTAFREETFGPLAVIARADDADHAVALANDSAFGLSGAIWSEDAARARALARRVATGGVFVNGYAASDPRVPIGGVKKSGYGRELSHFGIREFTNAQLMWEDR